MKCLSLMITLAVAMSVAASSGWAIEAKLSGQSIKAGTSIGVDGSIAPGQDLFVVIANEEMFKPEAAIGVKEKSRLVQGNNGKNAFAGVEAPANYYVVTNVPEQLAVPKEAWKGQTKGLFAFPPFKYRVMVNKLKKWEEIDPAVQAMLGSGANAESWQFLAFTHEDKFGINTIAKEEPVGGGNVRMVLTDHGQQAEAWNEGVSVQLDKQTGKFAVTMSPYKHIRPDTRMAVWVNGEKVDSFAIEGSGFYFNTASVYMNPLIVFGGAFIIGCLFVIMGAAGGLFTAAFQITVIGTKGPVGINAGNTIKPTNLFLTMCSPITGLMTFIKEKRFAYPVAISFAIGIVLGAFFIGPPLSAKYLNLAAFKFYLGILCLIIGIKLFTESLPSAIEKKKAMKAIIQKFNAAVKEAKSSGKAMEMGKVEFEKFNPIKFDMTFWGETFVARPLMMLVGGIAMGVIASAFGVGGGFMFMPFMTTLVGYPMYLAVPIALAGTFATSVGAVSKYVLLGYQPDWIMAALIAAGAMAGGYVGPKIQKMLPEILLKRLLAGALILTCLQYTGLLWFMR